jgi:uncharacterized protein YndB with AHSA1/START domain
VAAHEGGSVSVSRRIQAPAADIFRLLADPSRHVELEGSDMLRGSVSTAIVSGVGDVFIMKMYYAAYGDYEMDNHVVEYELNRRIAWEPVDGRGHPEAGTRAGHRWSYELAPDGTGATVVTESFDCSRAPADLRAELDDGNGWIPNMTATLARLDDLCTAGKGKPG